MPAVRHALHVPGQGWSSTEGDLCDLWGEGRAGGQEGKEDNVKCPECDKVYRQAAVSTRGLCINVPHCG